MMNETLMVFPCDFPIKIIGNATPNFLQDIITIVHHHFPDTPDSAITTQLSGQGKYQSITAVVVALDQMTLDALYKDLTQHPDIRMVL
ncbi:MAG: hypothetical protein CK424_01170 [Legionella sp.]|nr:MAG: hypothetical protein CK424_01170 [Legionella sp.]